MKTSFMRWVDHWAGLPVCFLLTLWKKLRGTSGHPPRDLLGKKVLFIKLAEQGSTVLAYPMLKRAADVFGKENIYFLVFQENRFILDALEVVPPQQVIAIPQHTLLSTVSGAVHALWKLRQLQVDFAIDMEFFARSTAALSFLSGARWRVGFHAFHGEAAYRGDLMTHRLICNQQIHTSDLFSAMLDAVFEDPDSLPTFGKIIQPAEGAAHSPRISLKESEVLDAWNCLTTASAGLLTKENPLVLVNSNCGDLLPLRRWSSENYRSLARRLLDRYPSLHIAFTGGPSEASYVKEEIAQVGHRRCFNLAGHTSLRQLLAVYHIADVMITNDSGPAHFASLTPMDTVTLFGPETPALFGARSANSHPLWAGLACSPCVSAANGRQTVCRNNLCMQSISLEQVFEKVCQLLERRQPGLAADIPGKSGRHTALQA